MQPIRQAGRSAGFAPALAYDDGLRAHMLRIYNYMGLGLLLTGFVAVLVASVPAIYVPIFSTPLRWVVMLAPLAFVMFLSFRIESVSGATAQTLFWAFCAVMGLSLASIFLVFTGTSIARAFFGAAAMFAGMSLYGYTTRRDLSKFGSFLMMGLIVLEIINLPQQFNTSADGINTHPQLMHQGSRADPRHAEPWHRPKPHRWTRGSSPARAPPPKQRDRRECRRHVARGCEQASARGCSARVSSGRFRVFSLAFQCHTALESEI